MRDLRMLLKKISIITLLDAITSQIYIGYDLNGFRISMSVIILPIYYYFNPTLNPILTSLFIGSFGLIFRGIIGMGIYGSFFSALQADFPIFIFDVSYGFIYYFLVYAAREKTLSKWILTIWLADFASNLFELAVRIGPLLGDKIKFVDTLITVAFIRTAIAAAAVFILKYYNIILMKDEQYERFKSMYTVLSDLKSEIYFMQNNMEYIEQVMGEAYELYERLAEGRDPVSHQLSLKIAKDVHEIKKNYFKVIEGIDKIGTPQNRYGAFRVRELLDIVVRFFKNESVNAKIELNIIDHLSSDHTVTDHFLFVSVIRNLISNSIEAIRDSNREGRIDMILTEDEENLILTVRDNGPGIKKKDVEAIFEPGFSTKFNPSTGDIYRGLGLTLVQDIVEMRFGGRISVRSTEGEGTEFIVAIDKLALEEALI
jgi:two-component system sensor histidine kinase YcbA